MAIQFKHRAFEQFHAGSAASNLLLVAENSALVLTDAASVLLLTLYVPTNKILLSDATSYLLLTNNDLLLRA